nr:hypothetical protein [Parachlamydiaceae bacterium]
MTPLQNSLTSFTEHLEQNLSFTCSKAGWRPDNFAQRFKNKIFSWLRYNKDAHLESIGKCFSSALDSLEHLPVNFNLETSITSTKQPFAEFLSTAKLVKNLLKTSKSSKVCHQLSDLAVKVAALRYRIEGANGGLDPSASLDEKLYDHLKVVALKWKENQKLVIEHDLTERDLKNLKNVCAYPKYAKLLLKDKLLRQDFFKWSLRDNCAISPLIQFPSICQRLKSCYIMPRLGRFSGDALT